MSDWLKPDVTADSYVNYTNFLKNRDVDLAVALDPAVVTVTSPPTNAIRWNSANGYWEKFNGTTWGVLAATYHIAVDSAAAVPFSGVSGKPTTLAGYGITDAAPLASPALTGTPTAPTAAVDTNTTQLATTAYVIGQAYSKLASPTFTGTPAAPTAAVDTSTTQLATTAFVINQAYLKSATAASTYAPLASPTFTGSPKFTMGTGSGTAPLVGAADVNTTAVGNVGAGPDDLMTYSLPANSLSSVGKRIRATMRGTTTNNANAKTVGATFGNTNFTFNLTPSIAGRWAIVMEVTKTGSSTQDGLAELRECQAGPALTATKSALTFTTGMTVTDTAAITIKAFADAVSQDNDIVQKDMLVEFLN